jgi:hypothetical protein
MRYATSDRARVLFEHSMSKLTLDPETLLSCRALHTLCGHPQFCVLYVLTSSEFGKDVLRECFFFITLTQLILLGARLHDSFQVCGLHCATAYPYPGPCIGSLVSRLGI